jgi:ribosome biogenesis GTPase A
MNFSHLRREVSKSDFFIEIVDIRAPLTTKIPEYWEEIIKDKKIMILNKKDLADNKITKLWKKYFTKIYNFPVIVTNLKKQNQEKILGKKINNYLKKINKENVIVSILGHANVGKSTLINILTKKKKVHVENIAGTTKGKQYIRFKNMLIIDTPGFNFKKRFDVIKNESNIKLSLIKSIDYNLKEIDYITEYALQFLIKNYLFKLIEKYKINFKTKINFEKEDLFILIAKNLNFKMKNNEYDILRAKKLFIKHLQDGGIKISWEKPESNNILDK